MNRFSTSLLTLLALTATVAAQDPVDLNTNAKAGTTAWFLQVEKNLQTIDMAGQAMETGQTVNNTFRLSVTGVNEDGSRNIELEISRVHGSMAMPMMGELTFDSAEDGEVDDPMGVGLGEMVKQMTSIAGHTFTAKVDGRGKLVGDMMPAGDDAAKKSGKDHVSAAKQLVEAAFGNRPEKALAVGEKWKFDMSDESGRMPTKNDVEATFAEATDEHFVVKFSGTMTKGDIPEGDGDEDPMRAEMLEGMEISNGKMSGDQKLSRKDGLVTSATAKVTADISVESPMGSMEMKLNATKTLSRTAAPKKKEAPAKAAETGK